MRDHRPQLIEETQKTNNTRKNFFRNRKMKPE